MDSKELNRRLLAELPRIIQTFFPGAKKEGHEWKMNNLQGEPGNRLKIHEVKGLWSDFGGQNEKAGDLIQLFIALNNGDKTAGIRAAHSFIGVPFSGKRGNFNLANQVKYKAPELKDLKTLNQNGPVYKYLTEDRRITKEILELYSVREYSDGNGPGYAFVYVDTEKETKPRQCLVTYVALKRNPDGSKIERRSKDGKDSLFGAHIDFVTKFGNPKTLIVTEGQIDAMSYAAQGIFAVSIPSGAKNNKWIDNCWDFISQFDEVFLSYDMDSAGTEAIETVTGRLGIERCKKIKLPFKDANECHVKGIQFTECVDCAEEIKPARFADASELREEVWTRLKLGPRHLQGVPWCGWDSDDETIKFRQRPKEITLVSGWPGGGKSTGLYQHAAYLLGDLGKKVAIASLEEDPEVIIQLIMTQVLAKNMDGDNADYETFCDIYDGMISGRLFVYNHRGLAPAKEVFDFMEYAANRHGCDTVIIDSLLRTDLDIEDNQKANEFMDRAISCVNSTGTHLYIVAHSNKGGSADEGDFKNIPKMNSVKGSSSISGIAFNILVFWKNINKHNILSNPASNQELKDKAEKWPDGMLCVRKQKVGGQVGEYPIFHRLDTGRFRRIQSQNDQPYIKSIQPKESETIPF